MTSARPWWVSCFAPSHRGVLELLRLLKRQRELALRWVDTNAPMEGDAAGTLWAVTPADLAAACRRLAEWRIHAPQLPRLCIAFDLPGTALAALAEAGATDCLAWPVDAAQLAQRLQQVAGLAAECRAAPHIRGLVYASEECGRIARKLPVIAACNASVLIVGETGTGKEVCAQAVHYLSPRSAGPWVAVNCAAIPAELLESELFGHVKGAYTSASATRTGLVREAEGGTLFLDDIDCLPLVAQGKLLRFLQEFEYRPVGANAVQHADVRVVAASNRDLRVLSQQGSFRQDLFFRLSVLRIELPPLRQRRGDVAVLARHFTQELRRGRLPDAQLSDGALARLLAHDWPGNVRELRHVIERAVLLAEGPDIEAADIEIEGDADSGCALSEDCESFQSAKKRCVADFERRYIEALLLRHRGNVTHAASAARKNRRAFFELIRKHGIDARSHRGAA